MVDWYGKTWLAPRTHRLKPDHGYTGFDRLLLNATERLKDGERVVTAQREAIGRLAELKGDIDYEPIEEYLLHLFKRHHGANGQGKHLREEIAMEVQPKAPTTKGPADWFTGDVYVDLIAQAQGSAVTVGGVVSVTAALKTTSTQ